MVQLKSNERLCSVNTTGTIFQSQDPCGKLCFHFCSTVKTTLCWVVTFVIATSSSSIKKIWQKAKHGVADFKFQLSWWLTKSLPRPLCLGRDWNWQLLDLHLSLRPVKSGMSPHTKVVCMWQSKTNRSTFRRTMMLCWDQFSTASSLWSEPHWTHTLNISPCVDLFHFLFVVNSLMIQTQQSLVGYHLVLNDKSRAVVSHPHQIIWSTVNTDLPTVQCDELVNRVCCNIIPCQLHLPSTNSTIVACSSTQ